MKQIRAGIVGASGYTGGEVLRLLVAHPIVASSVPVSRTHAGKPVTSVHSDLIGDIQVDFVHSLKGNESVIFLCLPHGESGRWLEENKPGKNQVVIDLGQDFRLQRDKFVYGLSELNHEQIIGARRISNPGCFATLVQLMLIPFAKKNLLPELVEISATTGSTGAGVSPTTQTHFSWRAGNHSAYKTLAHQHLGEISETLCSIQKNWDGQINMVPFRGSFTRGIHAVIHFTTSTSVEEVRQMFASAYEEYPFVHVIPVSPDVKQVVNTNKCLLHIDKVHDRIIITGVLDNLLKGASGQAVQNMNLALGLPETTGLKLKPLAY